MAWHHLGEEGKEGGGFEDTTTTKHDSPAQTNKQPNKQPAHHGLHVPGEAAGGFGEHTRA